MSRVGFKLTWGKEEKLVQDVFIDRSVCGKVAMTFTFNDNTIKKILIGDEEKADLFHKHKTNDRIESCHLFSIDLCWTTKKGDLYGMNYTQ